MKKKQNPLQLSVYLFLFLFIYFTEYTLCRVMRFMLILSMFQIV